MNNFSTIILTTAALASSSAASYAKATPYFGLETANHLISYNYRNTNDAIEFWTAGEPIGKQDKTVLYNKAHIGVDYAEITNRFVTFQPGWELSFGYLPTISNTSVVKLPYITNTNNYYNTYYSNYHYPSIRYRETTLNEKYGYKELEFVGKMKFKLTEKISNYWLIGLKANVYKLNAQFIGDYSSNINTKERLILPTVKFGYQYKILPNIHLKLTIDPNYIPLITNDTFRLKDQNFTLGFNYSL